MATTDVNTPVSNPQPRTRIRHHCIVTKLMEVNASLSDQCKKLLRTTPFGWLLNLHCNIEASGRMLEVMLATWNADERALIKMGSYAWGKAVYEYLICGLNRAAASKKARNNRGNLHIQGCTALLQIWACKHLWIGEKYAEINQSFPRFLVWSHQRMFSQKAMAAFNSNDNVLVRAYSDTMGATGIREDIEQNQQLLVPTEKTPIVDLPSSPSKAVKRGKPAKKKAKAAMVDLASSLSKRVKRGRLAKNEREAAMVDLANSPSKGAMVDLWVDALFLYQPTTDNKGVLADLRRKWSLATKRVTRSNRGVDSDEVAISTET
uniref:Aminotransferase-like plant mobile domain-containing protein n=1 Tax=Fagus sylvatica TaxID=28930 RepID=A0A2N9GHQ8_FAGSY